MGNLMKKIIKKILGLDEVEANLAVAAQKLEELEKAKKAAEEALVKAKEEEELAKLTPKERATRKKEPWISVLNTHVNKDNIRNGFFELDWNEYFVLKLKQEGYGFEGDKDEEIVDRWFRELCANVVVDEGGNLPVNTGVIDIQSVKRNNT
jgi:uncharacterized membrane-anchored protein